MIDQYKIRAYFDTSYLPKPLKEEQADFLGLIGLELPDLIERLIDFSFANKEIDICIVTKTYALAKLAIIPEFDRKEASFLWKKDSNPIYINTRSGSSIYIKTEERVYGHRHDYFVVFDELGNYKLGIGF